MMLVAHSRVVRKLRGGQTCLEMHGEGQAQRVETSAKIRRARRHRYTNHVSSVVSVQLMRD